MRKTKQQELPIADLVADGLRQVKDTDRSTLALFLAEVGHELEWRMKLLAAKSTRLADDCLAVAFAAWLGQRHTRLRGRVIRVEACYPRYNRR